MPPSTLAARRERVEKGIYRPVSGGVVAKDRYEIGWTDANGRQRWKIVRGGITAARAALAEENARKGRGEVNTAHKLTFGEAAEAYWDARSGRIRASTREVYRRTLDNYLLPRWGKAKLSAVTAAEVAKFIADQEADGQRGWTTKGRLTPLSGIFAYSSRHLGYTGPNPVGQLDRTERPRDDAKQKRVLSPDELDRLLAAVDEPYRLLYALAAETGGRKSEVLGLTWGDVDTEARTIRFAKQPREVGSGSI